MAVPREVVDACLLKPDEGSIELDVHNNERFLRGFNSGRKYHYSHP